METVKVDVQKLQILNDRLTQCLEALGQVRMSAHSLQPSHGSFNQMQAGISHTNPFNQNVGQNPYGQFAQNVGYGYGQPYNVWNQVPQHNYGNQGISHTGVPFNPNVGQNPFGTQVGQNVGYGYGQPYNVWGQNQQVGYGMPQVGFGGISHSNPWMPVGVGQQMIPQIAQMTQQVPWFGNQQNTAPFYGTGISHTSVMQDPYIAARVAQTFPFAFFNVPVW